MQRLASDHLLGGLFRRAARAPRRPLLATALVLSGTFASLDSAHSGPRLASVPTAALVARPQDQDLTSRADAFESEWLDKKRSGELESTLQATYSLYEELVAARPFDERTARWHDHTHEVLRVAPNPTIDAFLGQLDARWYRDTGDLQGAVDALDAALEVLPLTSDGVRALLVPLIQIDRAEIFVQLARFADAAAALEVASEALDPSVGGHGPAFARLEGVWVEYHHELGRPDRAKPHLDAEEEHAFGSLGTANNRLAWILHLSAQLLATREYESLVEHVGAFLDDDTIVPPSGAARGMIEVRVGLALLHLERRSVGASTTGAPPPRRSARFVLESALGRGLPTHHALSAQKTLARLHLANDSLEEAARWTAAARSTVENWRGGPRIRPWVEVAEVAALEVRLALARGDEADELASSMARLERESAALFERWEGLDSGIGEVASLHYNSRLNVVGALIEGQLAIGGTSEAQSARRAFESAATALGRGRLAAEMGSRERDGGAHATAIELAGPGGGALLYVPSVGRSHVFAVDENYVVHAHLEDGARLDASREALVDAFQRSVASRTPDDYERADLAAEHAASLLLPDSIRTRISSWNRVLVTGLETLGYVPFECLPVGGELLGDRLPVAYLPSFAVARGLIDRRGGGGVAPSLDLRLLAAPTHSPAARARWPVLETLPWSDSLELEFTGVYGAARTRALTGSHATVAALMNSRAPRAAALQIIAHGAYDATLDRPATIILGAGHDRSDPGLLTGDLVRQRSDWPELVVLATCGAARSPLRRGEDGSAHLGGAFLAAGAQCVVLPRIDVGYGATLELTRRLHEALRDAAAEEIGAAEALYRARLSLRDHPRYGRPEHRALLHALGLGFDPVPVARADAAGSNMSAPPSTSTNSLQLSWLTLSAVAVALAAAGVIAIIGLARSYRRD